MKAPIAFFAYKRPIHTLRSLESLAKNEGAKESTLFVFCDGSKGEEDRQGVDQVRRIVKKKKWCGKVNIIEKDKNYGLENSIINGVTDITGEYGKVIVIEDDLLLSPFFLHFMNESLDRYANDEIVMHISGYNFNVKLDTNDDAIFLPFSSPWGWGMWRRAWKYFQMPALGYDELRSDLELRKRFDVDGSYYFYQMLEQQMMNKNYTWDIQWYLTMFLRNGLCLYPARTLVANLGWDGSGSHGLPSFQMGRTFSKQRVKKFPQNLSIDEKTLRRISLFLKNGVPRRSFLKRQWNRATRKILAVQDRLLRLRIG